MYTDVLMFWIAELPIQNASSFIEGVSQVLTVALRKPHEDGSRFDVPKNS
jgi:hypothetical protein